MSRNYAELEQEMIADLAPRTGRDLAQWMAAIGAAGLRDKNAIIDWLRPQGFTFANASWLERIHNNGGRPIYMDAPPRPTAPPAALRAAGPSRTVQPASVAQPTTTGTDTVELARLLAKGKAFRPLAEMLISEIGRALPGTACVVVGDLVGLVRPRQLGVLAIGARELRLGLDLGDHPFDGTLVKARIAGAGPAISHMLVLTDARQVGHPLLELVRRADARVNR